MSQFIVNQSCDMCKNTDTGLVKMTIGDVVHHLCYSCMWKFGKDVKQFLDMNYNEEQIKKIEGKGIDET